MTAKKLTAEELAVKMEMGNHDWADDAAEMLRQQQAEIESLKSDTIPYKDLHQVVKNVLAQPMRELTDEEILFLYAEHINEYFGIDTIGFARALLKKAREK